MRCGIAIAAALSLGLVASEPLLLTPLIKANKTADARAQSAINVEGISLGHSGYFTVDSPSGKKDNNLFTWFQPCSKGCGPSAPFVLWFQGGPGGPGTFGALTEIGSHYVDKNLKLQERAYSWCQEYNCLFIDQPVQTGFSFQTDKKTGKFEPDSIEYTSTSDAAMAQVLEVLLQFYEIWPEYHSSKYSTPFYITGESYGGLYTSHMAKTVLDYNKRPSVLPIELRGVAVGDPILDARAQWPTYANTLYGMGVVMLEQRAILEDIFTKGVAALGKNCTEAFEYWNSVWNDDGGGGSPGLYYNFTGSSMTENVLLGEAPAGFTYWTTWLKKLEVQKAFHFDGVPTSSSDEGGPVYHAFVHSGDFCSNSPALIFGDFVGTTPNVDLMIYSSTADPLLGPPTTEAGVGSVMASTGGKNVAWDKAERVIWKVSPTDHNVAGYAKCTDEGTKWRNRFCYVVVRNGGHELPAFEPRTAYDMFRRFVERKNFDATGDSAAVPNVPECSGVPPFAGSEVIPSCAGK